MSEEGSQKYEAEVEVLFEHEEETLSSEEPPQEEWSSLLCFLAAPDQNEKRRLFQEGLYKPPSSEICAKYIPLSDSSVLRHPYYNYPSVKDPGVEEALLHPPPVIEYSDDGQDLYLALCKEMGEAYSRIFHKQLLYTHMNMSYYGISTYGWRPMAMVLKNNHIVQSINFTSNFISIDGCYHIGNMLLFNFTITELDFTSCRMGAEGMKNLVKNFPKNKNLRKLNVSKNALTDAGAKYLCNVLYLGSNVTDINLSFNGLTSITANNLATAIEFINKITHLDLSFNSLTVPRPVETLVSRFLESEVFVEINLAWNSLSNRFAKAVSNLLLCPNIEVIKLNNNNLTGPCIGLIADNLNVATHLRILDLSFNPLTIQEARLLLNKMRFKKIKLKELLLDNINVDQMFVRLRNRILNLKFRSKAVITHGYVVPKILGRHQSMREITLSRAQFLCRKPKKKRVDVGKMILQINKDKKGEPMYPNEFTRAVKNYGAFQINKDLAEEMAGAFPGPRVGKVRMADMTAMADYVKRKWPDTYLPPTPPPKKPPEPIPPVKGKDLGKGKDVGKGKGKDVGKGKDAGKGKKGKKR